MGLYKSEYRNKDEEPLTDKEVSGRLTAHVVALDPADQGKLFEKLEEPDSDYGTGTTLEKLMRLFEIDFETVERRTFLEDFEDSVEVKVEKTRDAAGKDYVNNFSGFPTEKPGEEDPEKPAEGEPGKEEPGKPEPSDENVKVGERSFEEIAQQVYGKTEKNDERRKTMNGVSGLVDQILACDDKTFAKLKRAIGESSRPAVAEAVKQDNKAASAARAVFAQVPAGGADKAIADRVYPSGRHKKLEF